MEGHPLITYRLWSVILVLAMMSLAPVRVLAMTGGGVSVFPASTKEYPGIRSWFVYEAEPGTEIKDKVLIKNHENRSITLNVAVLDGAVTNDGGYTLVGGIKENKDLGTWATLSRNSVTLPPQTQQTIDLTVKVPPDADVGSHPGGVVIWEDKTATTANKQKSAGQLSVITRVAARLYLTVPGDIIRKLRIENLRHNIFQNVLYFKMTMHNDGNVQLTPKADIKLRGIFGSVGVQDASQFGMILRGGTIQANIPWQKKVPKFGRFVADFRIHYGEEDFKGEYVKDEYQDVRYVFWLIPWMTILWWLIALALLLLVRKFWLWIMIRQRLNTKTREHQVKKGETLTMVASIYGADPKKIAKFNLLKWPYDLTLGDVLLIPQGQLSKEERKLLPRHSGEPLGRLQNRINQSIRSWTHPSPRLRRADASQDDGKGIGRSNEMRVADLELVIIEAGDTIKTVAQFAGVSERDIIRINQLKRPYKLRIGQELLIPVSEASELEEEIHSTAKPKSTVIKVKSTIHRRTAGASKERLSRRIKKTATSKPISSKRKPKK